MLKSGRNKTLLMTPNSTAGVWSHEQSWNLEQKNKLVDGLNGTGGIEGGKQTNDLGTLLQDWSTGELVVESSEG